MKSEKDIEKEISFLESQIEILINMFERKPDKKILELVEHIKHEVELLKYVLDKPSTYLYHYD